MVRDRTSPFLKSIAASATDVRAIVEALRIFGYINEMEYSELNTELTVLTTEMVRGDGAETIELARHNMTPLNDSGVDPDEIPGMIPREY